MQLNKLFKYSFFVASMIEVLRNAMGWSFEHYSKPLIIFTLLLYYVTSGVKRGLIFYLIIMALIFSWLGDSLLMYQQTNSMYFIGGLSSFLLAHILYSISYFKLRWTEAVNPLLPTQKLRHSITLILVGVALVSILSPNLGDLRLPVTIYAAVLVFMTITALLRYGYTPIRSFSLVFGGAICFMISDSLLAINKFMEPLPYAGFWIILTYCLAQFMIVEGIINHQEKK